MAKQYFVEVLYDEAGGDPHGLLERALIRCLESVSAHLQYGVAVEDDCGEFGRSTIAGWRELGLDVTTPGRPIETTIRLRLGPAWDRDIEAPVMRVEAVVDQPALMGGA